MSEIILDRYEVKRAVIDYLKSKYNLWHLEKQLIDISNNDNPASNIHAIKVVYDKEEKVEKNE